MCLQGKKLLLVDGLGALLTTLILVLVLAPNEQIFGMPKNVLYGLSSLAGLFSLYSIVSFLLTRQHWKPFLKLIAYTNSIYCVLSIALVLYFFDHLTILGVVYFCLEIVIIVALIAVELKASRTNAG